MMTTKRYAVIFPGQGSQALGMMAEYQDTPMVQHVFEEASDTLKLDMWALMNDANRLNQTQYTQPALLTASMAIWQVLQDKLPHPPLYLAGHSLGEYSALCASGVIAFADALLLVQKRGQLMTDAALGIDTQMAALLGLGDEQVVALCQHAQANGIVNPANFNSPGQVVIAGCKLAVERVLEEVQTLGKKAVPLKVSVPSHCDLMKPAGEKLAEQLYNTPFSKPNIDVIQNLTASVSPNTNAIKEALIYQLSKPVQWAKTMEKLADKRIEFIIECGYGSVLANLCKRQDKPIAAYTTDKPSKLDKLWEQFDES